MLLSSIPFKNAPNTRAITKAIAKNRNLINGTRLFSNGVVAGQNTLIRILRANVYRFGDGNKATPIFKDVEWTVKGGESWAIVGPAGSEKTDFLEVSQRSLLKTL